MFMVNSSREGTSFWAKHKTFIDGAIWVGLLFVGLKVTKAVIDKYDLWTNVSHLYLTYQYNNHHFSIMKVSPSNYGFTVNWQDSLVCSSKLFSASTFYYAYFIGCAFYRI